MNSKVYKCCAVPQCKNTSITTPNKLFVSVPHKKNIRYKWLKLARRDSTPIFLSTQLYFCEDHFDLPNDMENYMKYHLMGSVSQVRMKPGCMPTKFQCQPDRRKRTSNATERPYILKKQRKTLIEECEQDLKERTIASKQLELGETSSGSLDPGLGPGDVPEVCRTCLATGVRMYDVAARGLHDTFETVTRTQLLRSEQRPTQVCYVCWSQLQRFRAFCQMSRRADAYMTQLLSEGKQITEQDVSLRHQLIKQNLDVKKFPLTAIHTQEDPEECAFAEVKNKVKVENISDSETETGSETGICMRELETNESDERLESMVGVEIKVEEEDIDIEEFDPFKDLEQNTVRHETGLQCSEEGNLTSQKPLRSRKKRSFRLTAPKRSRKDRAGKKTKIKHSSGEITQQEVSKCHRLIKPKLNVKRNPLIALHTQEDPDECAIVEVKVEEDTEKEDKNISDFETESETEIRSEVKTGTYVSDRENEMEESRSDFETEKEIKIEIDEITIEEFDPLEAIKQTNVGDETCYCLQCAEGFPSQSELLKHAQNHAQKKLKQANTPGLNKKVISAKKNVKTKVESQSEFYNKTLEFETQLAKHVTRDHGFRVVAQNSKRRKPNILKKNKNSDNYFD